MKTKTIALLVLLVLSLLLSACNDDLVWWDGEPEVPSAPVRVDANTTCTGGKCTAEVCHFIPGSGLVCEEITK